MPQAPYKRLVTFEQFSIVWPRSQAKPGDVCEVTLGEGLEIVHVERIKTAAAVDFIAKERLYAPFRLSPSE